MAKERIENAALYCDNDAGDEARRIAIIKAMPLEVLKARCFTASGRLKRGAKDSAEYKEYLSRKASGIDGRGEVLESR